MILNMYSVHDVKSGVFSGPQVFVNEGVAMRAYEREFNNPQHMVYHYPEDYRIYEVGEWHDANGIVVPKATPKMVIEVKDLVKKEKK
jgi:hypothetical protein